MKEERIVLLGSLGAFTSQNLYLSLTSVLLNYAFYTSQDAEEIDEAQMLAASNELINLAITQKNQLVALLSDLPNLHKDDVAFFQKLARGYTVLIQFGELLHKFFQEYLSGDEGDIESDFIEFREKAISEIYRILGIQA